MAPPAALNGVVTKAALFIRPRYSQQHELRSLTKYKLHEAGFIIIREEYRRLNDELADKIAVQLDRAAFLSGTVASDGGERSSCSGKGHLFTRADTTLCAKELVGNAYLYVLAHRDCHGELMNFIEKLSVDDDYTSLLLSIRESETEVQDNNGSVSSKWQPASFTCPIFCNATAVAAKQVVQLLFPRMLVHDVPSRSAMREYVQAELKTALMPALVELSKAKPENPIRWLAERLLNTNVRAPPLISAANGEGDENK
ncbi:Dpy 30 motif [Trypanosoma vivax]|uniref:Uncharacterized protein n=1 Tax=Trypanosoma vivax (strain Y486) TaxID=1055687 RepID=G0UAT0_TRYVY|nr:hypothetical protein TRVL_02148 [Trypanosoma vivax]KAH8611166.1 Dpy 30 motif [Trypanosoma vivax]CCC52916.1 conserved hypothetical protein [Trypanosoma vivax Y486]